MLVSPTYNQQLASHTSDQSGLLFPAVFDEVLKECAHGSPDWAVRRTNGATELIATAPAEMIDGLFAAVIKLDAAPA